MPVKSTTELKLPRGTFWFWLGLVLLLVLAFVVFGEGLWPFGLGLILAFMMDPMADRLQRLGLSRGYAVLTVFAASALIIVAVLVLLLPMLTQQLSQFIESLPAIFKAAQDFLTNQLNSLREALPQLSARLQSVQNPLQAFTQNAAAISATFLASLWAGGQAVVNVVSLLLITPIVACYLLYDWDRMVAVLDKLTPRRDVSTVRTIAREMNTVLAAYLRGQALVCLLLGIVYSFGLTAIGLNFSLLIGLASGIISFVPYVGNIIGLGTALLVGFAQFGPEILPLASIAGVYALGQVIDGYVLQPRFLGQAVGIHPVWLIFALHAFGILFGFVGVLLAVPLAACLGVLIRHAVRYYESSQLYKAKTRSAAQKTIA